MSLTTWTLNEDSRWQISFDMETETPLHIGSGEFIRHDEIKNTSNEDQKFVDITACIKGKNNLPIIPGSTIKGQLYEWLKARGVENQLLENIFGKGHNPENKDQGKGGKAEFHDAYLTKLNTTSDEKTAPKDWPYWQEKTQTFIEASTAIDRHRQTALDQSLHYTETVPPGIGFRFTITGVMGEQEVALLIAAVDSFDKNQPCFGAADANGYGKMKFRENIKVKKMGTTEITHWLEEFTKNDSNDMVFDTIKYLEPKEIYLLLEQGKPLLKPIKNPTEIELTLTFSGPFLINDPSRVKALHTDTQKNTDHFPLLDKEGFPRLPSSSIRGVLRSQAERIFRTVGVKCCDTKTPCNTMYYKDDISELCPVCQIFGGSGWKSIIKIHDFVCTKTNGKKKQDFVAIDRFHGGGKDGAKFNATYYERPEFKGKITLTPRLNNNDLAWGKGLLTLILRDLKEGDMSFGFGRNKGYGDVESVNIDKSTLLFESDLQAFYTKINESNLNSRFCNSPKISTEVVEKIPLTAVNTASNGSFHNPYHFIPVKKPDTAYWTPHIELKKP